jgi:hypothetical protein
MTNAHEFAQRVAQHVSPSWFKTTTVEHKHGFEDFIKAQDIVKKYIQEHECILYGGIAIDYALRLRGDKIYEDTELPDFDFFTTNPIATAVEIVNIILAHIPDANVYAYRARFIRTMRISVGDNNWVADISYIPPNLFAHIPTLTFDGMRVVHPYFQYVDLHASIAYPYDNSPTEVIFARLTKDIKRFAKLTFAYPIPEMSDRATIVANMREQANSLRVAIPRAVMARSILQGFAAYSVYYNIIAREIQEHGHDGANATIIDKLEDMLARVPFAREPRATDGDNVILDVPYRVAEIVAHRETIVDIVARTTSMRKFAPLLDLVEASYISTINDGVTMITYLSSGKFPSYISRLTIDEGASIKTRAISIHGLMKYFISCYLRAKYFQSATPVGVELIDAQVYLLYYQACREFIDASREMSEDVKRAFEPTTRVFGDESIPVYDLIKLHANITKMIEYEQQQQPDTSERETAATVTVSVPPMRPYVDGRPNEFSYETCPIMRLSGEEL